MKWIQLVGPRGAFYVNPDAVASVGPAHVDEYSAKSTESVRVVTVVGGSVYFMYDTSDNMAKLLGAR